MISRRENRDYDRETMEYTNENTMDQHMMSHDMIGQDMMSQDMMSQDVMDEEWEDVIINR